MKTILSTADAPAAIGPYSQAVRSGEALYCSGQLGIDPATGKLPEGVAAQTEQSLKNIRALLAAAGAKTWSKPPCSLPTWRISRWSTRNTPKYSPRILPPVPAWRSRNCPSAGWLKSKCSPSSDSRNAPAPPTYGVNETLSPPFAARLTSLPAQDDAEEKKTRTPPANRRSFRFLSRRNRPVRAPVPSTAAPFSGLYCNFLE